VLVGVWRAGLSAVARRSGNHLATETGDDDMSTTIRPAKPGSPGERLQIGLDICESLLKA
jgi:hypothetical protein